MEFTKSEAKQWAKKNYKGLCCCISPSFTPDMKELDEEGIRWDVRHTINKGAFSVFCQQEICDMTFEERKRFVQIACEEAKGKALVSMFSGDNTVAEDIELLKHFDLLNLDGLTSGNLEQMFLPPRSEAASASSFTSYPTVAASPSR